jgi:molybdopterin molybdotransferase
MNDKIASMLSVEDARARILNAISIMPAEVAPLNRALGRVLASDLAARRAQPPWDISAMDGYAVRAADLAILPATLRVVGMVQAGQSNAPAIRAGEAARIFTGAIMPEGADMVAIQEDAAVTGEQVTISRSEARTGKNVRRTGSDFRRDGILLKAGSIVNSRRIALAAAMDYAQAPVTRRPRVGVLATGDELTHPGEERNAAQIVASSLYGVLAQIETWGCDAVDLGIVRDEVNAIRAAVENASQTDFIVTLGGASVGDHDLVQAALKEAGMELAFWRIAMRPGKPLMFGQLDGRPVLGLPGNPVSAMVCALLFLKPALYAMLGCVEAPLSRSTAPLGAALPANDAREDYLRAYFVDGAVMPYPVQDSGALSALAAAQVLLMRPAHDPARLKGEMAIVINLSSD